MSAREATLARRFLALPYRHQHAVASCMGVFDDDVFPVPDEVLYRELFRRTHLAGTLAQLWYEVERRHPDPATNNPFAQEEPTT